MEKLELYRSCIKNILLDHSKYKPAHGEIEVQPIFDRDRDHYQLMHLGWKKDQWVHSCILHLDITEGKIWLQWNATERDIAAELVQMGVPKTDIVIGFHSPFMRKFTEYAVG